MQTQEKHSDAEGGQRCVTGLRLRSRVRWHDHLIMCLCGVFIKMKVVFQTHQRCVKPSMNRLETHQSPSSVSHLCAESVGAGNLPPTGLRITNAHTASVALTVRSSYAGC